MLHEIQKLIKQIEEYLSDKEGFTTNITHNGAIIEVTSPSGETTSYDGYELVLYTLASRKLGSDIKLNMHEQADSSFVFAINTDAKLDLREHFKKTNEELIGAGNENILSVAFVDQPSDSPYPFAVITIYKNGNWMRYDLTLSEIMYAYAFDMKLELEDSTFTYPKLRELAKKVQEEVQK